MTRKKLFDDVLQNPMRIYRSPGEVLRDRRFGDAERADILRAWQAKATDDNERGEIGAMIVELEGNPARDHAAE